MSINIPEEITIVTRKYKDGIPMGYIANDKKSLENAQKWASSACSDYTSDTKVYKNGNFKLQIIYAPHNSNQGGRRAFWGCRVTDTDNNQFNIEVNDKALIDLIKCNSIINGEVQALCYLGRDEGQEVAITESMPQFQKYKEEQEAKARVKAQSTSKYQVGDILEGDNIYLGIVYQYFEIKERKITIFPIDNPKVLHLFGDNWSKDSWYPRLFNSKVKRIMTGKTIDNAEELKKKIIYFGLNETEKVDEYIRYSYNLPEELKGMPFGSKPLSQERYKEIVSVAKGLERSSKYYNWYSGNYRVELL